MKPWRSFLLVIIWLTRIAGAVITVCGISFFVLAWAERSVTPVVMGLITVGIGFVVISIRATATGRLEYGLFGRDGEFS
jgi:multidrug efflux pump subunit AcrA (membrane-fusion protein)